MLSKTVHNDCLSVVDESLQGLLLTRPDLELVAPARYRVLARRSIDPTKVALVCGGGSGHEPAHAAFTGSGLLTASVSGDIFASPTVPAVACALLHAAGPQRPCPGVLLVIKNYTGDRLAFAAAAERARALGVAVETVYVCDDAALEGGACIGRRGLAGTVLVYKVAGALAEAGAPLRVVAAAARAVAARVHTYGASLSVCDIPGRAPSARLAGPAMELGLGIHGEPGATLLQHVPSATELCSTMLAACAERLRATQGAAAPGEGGGLRVALLVNNYGGLSLLEQGVVVRSAVAWFDQQQQQQQQQQGAASAPPLLLRRLIAGPCMTSLGMRGFSLTLLALGPVLAEEEAWAGERSAEALLDAPVACGAAWPGCVAAPGSSSSSSVLSLAGIAPRQGQGSEGGYGGGALLAYQAAALAAAAAAGVPAAATPAAPSPASTPLGLLLAPAEVEASAAALDAALLAAYAAAAASPATAALLLACLQAAAAALGSAEAQLNALDAKVGDGDCGSTCAGMGRAALGAAQAQLQALAGGQQPPRPTLSPAAAAAALGHPSLRPMLAALCSDLSDALAEQCGGSSGLLYALLLRAAAAHLSPAAACERMRPVHRQLAAAGAAGAAAHAPALHLADSCAAYGEACLAALQAVGVAANSAPGQRSMLDALHPAARALLGGGEGSALSPGLLQGVAAAAEGGAAATAAMAPVAGRSCWVAPEVARGVQDPGAAAAAVWVGAVVATLQGLLGGAQQQAQ